MSFLKNFADGFLKTSSETLDRRSQLREQEDLDRKKRLNEVDAQKILLDYKLTKEEEVAERMRKRVAEERLNDFPRLLRDTANSAAGATKVDTPNVEDPSQMEQMYTEAAANAAARGDDDAYKSNKARADVFGIKTKTSKQSRDEGRQGNTSIEGLKPSEELYKEDNDILSKPEIDSSLYFKYFGEPKALSPSDENDLASINQVKESSAQAVKLSQVLTSATSDERGISDRGAGELKADAINLVRLKNQYAISGDEQEKEALLANIMDIADNYPSAEGLVLSIIGVDQIMQPEETSQPVELTRPDAVQTDPDEGRTIINRKTNERMIRRNGTWEKL